MRFASFVLRHRRGFRIIMGAVLFLVLLALNVWVYLSFNTPETVFVLLLVPAINLLNEFSPELLSAILDRFRPSEYQDFVILSARAYSEFIEEYFGYSLEYDEDLAEERPLFAYLEELTASITDRPFGSTVQPDTRRRPIAVQLFLMRRSDALAVAEHENLLSYIKLSYKALSPVGQKELVYAYSQLVQNDRHFVDVESYFDPLNPSDFEVARLQFFDRYMKDDFINQITSLLNFQKDKIRSFKDSIRAVAESDELNLDYLREFVRKRKEYRKLFLVTSAKRLPKRIQSWIRQQAHFILNYSSIANLPRIGVSSRFDIFFFSPSALVPSADALFQKFCDLDEKVVQHPLKIYEVDPTEGLGIGLEQATPFSEAITYFETTSFDSAAIESLSYEQLISILENRKVSLQQVISELPPSEFSTAVAATEKQFLNDILNEFIEPENARGVFALANTLIKDVEARLGMEDDIPIPYSASEVLEVLDGHDSIPRRRARMLDLFRETKRNLKLIGEFIV